MCTQVLAFATFHNRVLAVGSGVRLGTDAVLVVDRLGLVVQMRGMLRKQVEGLGVLLGAVATRSAVLAGHVTSAVLRRIVVERIFLVADNSLVNLGLKFTRKARKAGRTLASFVSIGFASTAVDAKEVARTRVLRWTLDFGLELAKATGKADTVASGRAAVAMMELLTVCILHDHAGGPKEAMVVSARSFGDLTAWSFKIVGALAVHGVRVGRRPKWIGLFFGGGRSIHAVTTVMTGQVAPLILL